MYSGSRCPHCRLNRSGVGPDQFVVSKRVRRFDVRMIEFHTSNEPAIESLDRRHFHNCGRRRRRRTIEIPKQRPLNMHPIPQTLTMGLTTFDPNLNPRAEPKRRGLF
jgi:hypothetical protein